MVDIKFFQGNRDKLRRDLKDNEMIILASGREKYFSGDGAYKYRPNKNFYYYTGLNFDNMYYVCLKANGTITEKLFFDEVSPDRVKWIGSKFTKDLAKEYFPEIKEENIYNTNSLVKQLKKDISIHDTTTIYLDILDDKDRMDKPDLTHMDNALRSYLQVGTGDRKDITYVNVSEFTKLHRPYKEKYEIECIEKAIDITYRAILMVLKNLKKCKTENEVEAYLDFSTRKDGVVHNGFEPIVASGENAAILHYTDNNSKIEKGSLILFDIGYEYENYSSDVSRTFPTSGKFNDFQKQIYEIVLKTNKKVIESIKVGMTFKELNEIARKELILGLFNLELIRSDEELINYYWHSVSHPLGLDTHDLRGQTQTIEEGMVITVEPGLYMKDKKLGIRIEDDVLVLKKGVKVLTEKIPKEIDEIEKLMNK